MKEKKKNMWFLDSINDYLLSLQKIKTSEKVIFYRLLATMVNAWMSLVRSIWVLEAQEKNPAFKKVLWVFGEELKEWRTLSDCLAMYPNSFSKAEIWIVKSWEKTWKLNVALNDLAIQVEKVASMTGKLKSALTYPAFIILVVIGVVFIMMTMVVPKLLDIFDDKSSLPASTQLLISISDLFVHNWLLLILWLVSIIVWIKIWTKTPTWQYLFDKFLLHLPILWQVTQKIILSKFSRIFSWLIWSWVSIVESLKITAEALWNEVYRQRVLFLAESVKSWTKIWESIEWDKMFPEMMIQMIRVWEETAKLDQTIVKVADFYDEQVDNIIGSINKLLEPAIIIILAVIVWFIAIAIMQPIMNLSNTIANK